MSSSPGPSVRRPVGKRRAVGRTLVLAGVLVWVVYLGVWLAGGHPEAARFVPIHLAGVVPGAVLTRWKR